MWHFVSRGKDAAVIGGAGVHVVEAELPSRQDNPIGL